MIYCEVNAGDYYIISHTIIRKHRPEDNLPGGYCYSLQHHFCSQKRKEWGQQYRHNTTKQHTGGIVDAGEIVVRRDRFKWLS